LLPAVAVARSFPDGRSIHYNFILQVLWTTSFSRDEANMSESKTMRMFRQVRQVAAPGAKLLSTNAGLLGLDMLASHEKFENHCSKRMRPALTITVQSCYPQTVFNVAYKWQFIVFRHLLTYI